MKFITISLSCLPYGIAFITGVVLDRFVRNYPLFSLDKKLDVIEIGTLVATIAVAFMIPRYITKFIEDVRGVKQMLIEELRELLEISNEIQTVIKDAHYCGNFTPDNRDKVVRTFHELELKTDSIVSQTTEAFGKKVECTNQSIKNLVMDYQDAITGGELMMSSFSKVDERYFRELNTAHSKIETGVKTLMQTLYKL